MSASRRFAADDLVDSGDGRNRSARRGRALGRRARPQLPRPRRLPRPLGPLRRGRAASSSTGTRSGSCCSTSGCRGWTGFDVCRAMRGRSQVPILMLTARDEEPDRVVGLEVGADDYITKPFSPRELVARMKASSAAPSRSRRRACSTLGDVVVNRETHEVTAAGEPVELTAKEFELLSYFLANPGAVLSRDQLLDRVWGVEYPGRDADRRRPRRAAPPQARPAGADPDAPRRGVQGSRRLVRTLRARLFWAVLAAIVVSVALTVAIGAALARRTADQNDRAALARRADLLAAEERQQPSYIAENYVVRLGARDRRPARGDGEVRAAGPRRRTATLTLDERRLDLLVPPDRAARAAPARARVAPAGVGLVRPRPPARGRRRRGARGGDLVPRSPARSCGRSAASPTRAARSPRAPRRSRSRPQGTTELAALAQAFNEMAAELAAARDARARLPALGQPRAEDAADRDPRLRRGSRRGRVHRRGRRGDDPPRGAPARAARRATCSTSRG